MTCWLIDTWYYDSVFNFILYLVCTIYLPETDMLITWHLIFDTWYLTCYHLSMTLDILFIQWSFVSCTLVSYTHDPRIVTHVNSMVILASGRYATWCQDDEDVSHDYASIQWILNGIKCHRDQSATPHTWSRPPLESVKATFRIHSPRKTILPPVCDA